jgi:urease accessory protein
VIDVAGGDDIPRKRGLGVLQCDLLVINKTDLARTSASTSRACEANEVRKGKPVLLTNCAIGDGVDAVVEQIAREVLFDR